jgi:tRNA wybutosine-synthesizing protein 2
MGYQQFGDIFIFNKISKKEALKVMKEFPRVRTICSRTGRITGKLRKPRVKVVISRVKKGKTIAIHLEDGILYKIDVAKLMFSQGNMFERHRIAKLAKKNEIIVDMFAGIGYFTLPLAKHVKKVYAIELNPVSYRYLLENIKLNRLSNVEAIKGDCAKIIPKLKIKADRISMGFLPSPLKYLDKAFKISKDGTLIHYSCLVQRNQKEKEINEITSKIDSIASQNNFKAKLINAAKVKSFSPGLEHYVLDIILRAV